MKNLNLDIIHHKPVVSCIEASKARKVDFSTELKTILLKVSKYKIAVHLRGCDKIYIQAIKKLFKSKDISFLSLNLLAEYKLFPGVINPWNIKFCHFNLVCLELFSNKVMTTNNSKLTEGIFFKVEELLLLRNVILGYWGRDV